MDYQETQRYNRKVYNSSIPYCDCESAIALIQVFRSEVDFFVKRRLTEGELNTLKSDKFYPPRFEGYFASFRENATLDDGKIVFKGATSDIVYDIHLDCPTAIPAIKGIISVMLFQLLKFMIFTEAVDMSTHTESKLLLGMRDTLL